MQIRNFKLYEDPIHSLNHLISNERSTAALSLEYVRVNELMKTSRIYCLPRPAIYEYSSKFLVRKDFEFLNKLNRFILMAGQSGLISKWKNAEKIPFFSHDSPDGKKIRLVQFSVFIAICVAMLINAFMVLIIERIVHEYRLKLNNNKFWIFAETLIDSERHYLLKKIKIN